MVAPQRSRPIWMFIPAACSLSSASILGWLSWCEFHSPRIALIARPTRIDVGVVQSNQQMPVRFQFANEGSVTIEILSVESSCNCTASRLSQTRLRPEESVHMDVIVDSGTKSGHISSVITVIYRESGVSRSYRQVLEITGQVRADSHPSDS
jgi:hypothetical protein